MSDIGRAKSLLFLLTREARYLNISPLRQIEFDEALNTIEIIDDSDCWKISVIKQGSLIETSISKNHFIFYPTKKATFYESNPYEVNLKSARDILQKLFGDLVDGGTGEPFFINFRGYILSILPTILVFVLLLLFTLSSKFQSNLGLFASFSTLVTCSVIFFTWFRYLTGIKIKFLQSVLLTLAFLPGLFTQHTFQLQVVIFLIFQITPLIASLYLRISQILLLNLTSLIYFLYLLYLILEVVNKESSKLMYIQLMLVLFCSFFVTVVPTFSKHGRLHLLVGPLVLFTYLVVGILGLVVDFRNLYLLPAQLVLIFLQFNYGSSPYISRIIVPAVLSIG